MVQWAWVDLVLMGLLALSVIVGLWRGLVFELMALAGWIVAYVVAQAWSPQVGVYLPVGTPGSALHAAAAFAATFLGTLIAWMLLARLVRMLIRATPLTVVDRVLGGAFGLARGLLALLVLATLVSFTPAVRSQAWTSSQGAAWLGVLLHGIHPLLPDEVARHLPA